MVNTPAVRRWMSCGALISGGSARISTRMAAAKQPIRADADDHPHAAEEHDHQ